MAIDTDIKRFSAMNVACPWRAVLPIADSSMTQADRQVVGFAYSGILAEAVVFGKVLHFQRQPMRIAMRRKPPLIPMRRM